MKPIVLFVPIALLSLGPLSGCCTSAESRNAAQGVVEELARTARDRERTHETLLRQVLVDYWTRVRDEATAKWSARKAELKLDVTERTLAKQAELSNYVRTEMNQALGPRIQQTSAALDDAKARLAAGAGGEDKKNELALQLAATMSFSQKAVFDLDAEVTTALATVRKDMLALIDSEMATVPGTWDPAGQAEVLVQELHGKTDSEYLKAVDKGAAELTRFIHLQSAPALLLKGLLGDDLGGSLVTKLQSTAEAKLKDLAASAEAKTAQLLGKYDSKSAETLKTMRK